MSTECHPRMAASGSHLLVVVLTVLAVTQWRLLTALPAITTPLLDHHTSSRTSDVAMDTFPPPPPTPSASPPPPSSPPPFSPPPSSPPPSSRPQTSPPPSSPTKSSPTKPSPPKSSPPHTFLPHTSPPPSSSQRPLTTPYWHPCTPTKLEAWTDEDTNDTLTFHYRFDVEDPKACKGPPIFTKKMVVSSCDNHTLYKHINDGRAWLPEMNGSVEMCFGGCLRLHCGAFTSNEVYVHRVQYEILQLSSDVYLKSSTQLMVPLAEHSWPRWYKSVDLKVIMIGGRMYAGEATVDNQTSLLEVLGKYPSDMVYKITYKVHLFVDKCEVNWWRDLVTGLELELPVVPPPSKTGLVVGMVVLLLVVVTAGVLVVLLLQHLRRSLQAASTRPWLGLRRSKDSVLLVHAHDSTEVVAASHALTRDITSQCSRKVLDMCCLNDPSFVEDPSAWLLKTLTRQEDVTILLVVTAALAKVANNLKQSHYPEDWDPVGLGPEPDSRDHLIYDCLRCLQEKPTLYRSRLVLVRLPKDTTEESGLPHLTPRRPFLLSQPQEGEHLLAALHPHPGAGPPDNASLGTSLLQALMFPVNKIAKLMREVLDKCVVEESEGKK